MTDVSPLGLLVIGGSGYLGQNLMHEAKVRDFDVIGTYFSSTPHSNRGFVHLDKCSKEEISRVLNECQPDVIIDASSTRSGSSHAAYSQLHPERAWAVNVEGTENLLWACAKDHRRYVFISSDWVFDGERGGYQEDDPPNPINEYGRLKLMAERRVLENTKNTVIRTSVLIGGEFGYLAHDPYRNFVLWVIEHLRKGEEVNIVSDEYCTPTLVSNLASIILDIVEGAFTGLFHAAGSSCLSRLDLAIATAKVFDFPPSLVKPVPSNEFRTNINRPRNTCLDVSRIAELPIRTKPIPIEEALVRIKKELNQ